MQMEIKKTILAILIVFTMSFSYQPVNVFQKERESIVYVIEVSKEKHLDEFMRRNQTKKLYILVSLTMQCLMTSGSTSTFNSS